jgi:hypothetical protein
MEGLLVKERNQIFTYKHIGLIKYFITTSGGGIALLYPYVLSGLANVIYKNGSLVT